MHSRRGALQLALALPALAALDASEVSAASAAQLRRLSRRELRASGLLDAAAAVVVWPAGDGAGDAAQRLAQVLKEGPTASLPSGQALVCVALGPWLDQPDQLEAADVMQRAAQHLHLEIWHTSARASGRILEQNLRWRPLLQAALPGPLFAGRYIHTVSWHAVHDLATRRALQRPALDLTWRFAVA